MKTTKNLTADGCNIYAKPRLRGCRHVVKPQYYQPTGVQALHMRKEFVITLAPVRHFVHIFHIRSKVPDGSY